MRALVWLIRIRLAEVLRQPLSWVMLFGLPPLLLLTLTLVFSGGHPFERRHVAALDAEAAAAVASLGEDLVVERAESAAAARAALDSRMVSAVVSSREGGVEVTTGERERLFGAGLAARLEGSSGSPSVVSTPPLGYVHYLFPGLVAYSLLIAGLFGSGYTLLRYRQNLFLKKLAATPMPRATFVAALLCSRGLFCLVQVAALIVCARALAGLALAPAQVGALLGLSTLGLLVFMGIGFALACAARDEVVLMDIVNAAGVPLVFLSEIFFPIRELPGPLPALAASLPTTALVRLLRQVQVDPAGSVVGGELLLLAIWAVASYGVAVLCFRWER